MTYSAFRNDDNKEPERHYHVRILKLQPTKVYINGRLKDRTALTPEEHQAVQAQEAIDKAREKLYPKNDLQ